MKVLQPSKKQEPALRSMTVWALGRISSKLTYTRAMPSILSALQDPYFKVRAHACTAVAHLGSVEANLSP